MRDRSIETSASPSRLKAGGGCGALPRNDRQCRNSPHMVWAAHSRGPHTRRRSLLVQCFEVRHGVCMKKLTPPQILEVRERYLAGESGETLGRAFGVSGVAIRGLLKRRDVVIRAAAVAQRRYSCNHAFSPPSTARHRRTGSDFWPPMAVSLTRETLFSPLPRRTRIIW